MAAVSSLPSVVSIEPKPVPHITLGTRNERANVSYARNPKSTGTRKPGVAGKVTGARPAQNERRVTGGAAASQESIGRPRNNSLRHVKNSKELLRQRSNKRGIVTGIDAHGTSKEGRNFTVGNVGTGGLIYLRPSVHQTKPAMQASPFMFAPPTPPQTATQETDRQETSGGDNRQSFWSTSQMSELLAQPHMQQANSIVKQAPVVANQPSHERALSFSKSAAHENSDAEAQHGTLRIVINRAASKQPSTVNKNVQEAQDFQVPHYRIGNPLFGSQGTPILRSSAHSRASLNGSNNFRPSNSQRPKLLFPVRHSSYTKNTRMRPLSDMPLHTAQANADAQATHPIDSTTASPGFDGETTALAEDTIFDDLIQMQDDPSVVRYSQRTGDIVAATPARIIAQISSAAFMDYELVSDFFLTFRSYLSTNEVLDLLLSRLRWAINRLEDDGRIIRIRTFAALRHWILNYFVDDFVINRRLRVEFCNRINDLYRRVQQRNGGGTSDLKILQDLKRCWNGRCSLYWSSDNFVIDSHQKADIVPGGAPPSRDSSMTRLRTPAEQPAKVGLKPSPLWRPTSQSWFEAPPQGYTQDSHGLRDSTALAEGPVSIGSEKSLQPSSCSIPTQVLRRSPRLPNGTKQPHPIPSASRRQLSPSASGPPSESHHRTSTQTHKRSGSFTDSLRKPNSDHSSNQDLVFILPQTGSLIRGNIIPPGSPYIDVVSKAPMPQEQTSPKTSQSGPIASANEGLGIQMTPNSGVKTFIGSIRRALSNRQPTNGSDNVLITDSRTRSLTPGKKSALPTNLARSNDALRVKPVAGPNRTHLRIDLLSAAISHSYQIAQDHVGQSGMAVNHGQAEMSRSENSMVVPDLYATHKLKAPRRLVSQATAQSGSIMIVDDTGLDISGMSGALPVPIGTQDDTLTSGRMSSTINTVMSMTQSTYLGLPSNPSASRRSSGVFARRRSRSVDTGMRKFSEGFTHTGRRSSRPPSQTWTARRSYAGHTRRTQSTATVDTAIRRPASCSTGMGRREPDEARSETVTTLSDQQYDTEEDAHLPAHVLRRRPGGDLRKVLNVHDLDTDSRRQSNVSASSNSDSVGGSLVIMANKPKDSAIVQSRPGKGSISLINTHSSQHLRPSFEAAVSGFSAIPDDDDGGLEATLLKLEGKYEKQSPVTTPTSPLPHHGEPPAPPRVPSDKGKVSTVKKTVKQDYHQHLPGTSVPHVATSEQPLSTEALIPRSGAGIISHRSSIYGLPMESVDGSDDSYNSVPLLERGVTTDSAAHHEMSGSKPAISISRPPLVNGNAEDEHVLPESSHPSIEIVEETASLRDIPQGSTMPIMQRSPTAHSFLLDIDEDLSDLSSELSVDIINHSDVIARNPSPLLAAPGTAVSGLEIPTHPLAHPPSPSFTLHRLTTPPNVNPMMFQNPPLTPDPSPTQVQHPFSNLINHPSSSKETHVAAHAPAILSASSGHIPWVLAYESELLAEQMTLVEKAALSEIDWSDLVNMRWDNSGTTILNWVEFLSAGDHKGIDLVITRFNIMVKWTLSEIVLTQNIHERARTIMKYIHLAAHARRLHNYATMLQITIALTSSDCSRLRKTWDMVHLPERSLLKNMEALIQPLRNFHDLRVEMETADLTEGCVPFVGLYIHDLTYNAQKPAQITIARHHEPLINFERHRTTAAIVKGLLRLIDASSKFNFSPVDGVIERCLWMAALSDDRIHALSRGLEP